MANEGGLRLVTSADGSPVPFRDALRFCRLAGDAPLVLHLVLVVLQGTLPLAGLFAMQWLIDAVDAGIRGDLDHAAATDAIWRATAAAAAIAVLGNVVRSWYAVVAETHGRALADACTAQLQAHAARLDLAEFDRPAFHDLLHRAGTEAVHRPIRLVQDLAAFGTALVGFAGVASVLALAQPALPLLVGLAAVPIAVVRRREAVRRYRWQHDHTVALRDVSYAGGLLTGRAAAKDVRALGLRGWLGQRLEHLRGTLRGSQARLARRRALAEWLVQTFASLAMFGAYLYLGQQALLGALTIGGLVLHAQAVQRAQNAVRDLLGSRAAIAEDRLFLRPFVDFLARLPALRAVPPAVDPPRGPVRLVAEDLGFAYPTAPAATLRSVSFSIAPGERVAVVGCNGSGKSTLVKLLCRLYDPTNGRLCAHGVDLRHAAPERWRERVAVLFQDATAFEWTLRENLAAGGAAPPDEPAMWHALAVVGLDATVRALPLGLDTPLSARHAGGVVWSGGELRRLLLARTLLQPADLLLLDEPFAQLDGLAATRLATELAARAGRQTIVVVDHRRAVLAAVDRAMLLDGGRLVADGAPAELARCDARFAALFPSP